MAKALQTNSKGVVIENVSKRTSFSIIEEGAFSQFRPFSSFGFKPENYPWMVKQRKTALTKEELIAFETKVGELYENKDILAPIHLSAGNEDPLLQIFQYIHSDDWVFSTWRSHYHALLHGIDREWLLNQIIKGKSITINNADHRFFTSAIAGGTVSIAVGVANALKLRQSERKVWCFIGDMTSETGIFFESLKYSIRNDLPITFVIEDNGISTYSPTQISWGMENIEKYRIVLDHSLADKLIYYQYEIRYPHSGIGKFINF